MKRGKVFLVGAGPGDPQLLTLRALKLLRSADVVLYDKLVDPAVVRFARKASPCLDVGKKRGRFDEIQKKINRLMVRHARLGKKVIRLKGGDPLVFGRAGEEIDHLEHHDIAWEVVPGVSSATGVPTAAGIPLLWPGVSHSFAVATGHPGGGKPAGAVPVPKADTLVYLMGLKNLKNVAAALRRAAYPLSTPVAVVQSGSTARERIVVTVLDNLVSEVRRQGLRPPAVLVVGKTVRFRW